MRYFNLQNRRYVGSKFKILSWIEEIIVDKCNGNSFFDAFAGTGVVSSCMLLHFDRIILNDFLYSNYVIYNGFFGNQPFSQELIYNIASIYNQTDTNKNPSNYFDEYFGGAYFSSNDARKIGFIREDLNSKLNTNEINEREFFILLASLLYSVDKISNTVGHYDAFIRKGIIPDRFILGLINPLNLKDKEIEIYREDTNYLSKKVTADVTFIDPPYNSRQYSRFYHVLDNLAEWKKPELFGVALKPSPTNMSDYCRNNAKMVFADLISNLKTNFIAVTYNNTYSSKSTSSENKIKLDEILSILNSKGHTEVFKKNHQFFNAGKTEFNNHMEYLFITEVN